MSTETFLPSSDDAHANLSLDNLDSQPVPHFEKIVVEQDSVYLLQASEDVFFTQQYNPLIK